MTVTTCIFDAYGTLFDVDAAARSAADADPALAAVWPALSADWRTKQLHYSCLRTLTDRYVDFWQITRDALDWSLERHGLADPDRRATLLALYHALQAYPEVPGMLRQLRRQGLATGILSNGSPDMLAGAVGSAALGDLLDAVLSVAKVGVFKPSRAVYDMVGARFGTDPGQVLFVSSNGWDAAAAADYGFRVAWVNRGGDPPDRLPGTPHNVVADLSAIPGLLA